MKVSTYRFGEIEADEEQLVRFPEGLVGLARLKRFLLLADPDSENLYWLQSTDEPAFALAMVHSSWLDFPYEVRVPAGELHSIGASRPEEVEIFVILNRVDGRFTVNLRGPVLLCPATRLGKQAVLADAAYDVRHPVSNAPAALAGTNAAGT